MRTAKALIFHAYCAFLWCTLFSILLLSLPYIPSFLTVHCFLAHHTLLLFIMSWPLFSASMHTIQCFCAGIMHTGVVVLLLGSVVKDINCCTCVLQPKGRGDPSCGSRRCPRSFWSALYISWTNGWILTKLAQMHNWERGKKILDFFYLDLIFKVTPALWNFQILTKKACLHPICWTKWSILAKLHIL